MKDNEVKEVAIMQRKIDSYEGFIKAVCIMAQSGKIVNYPLFEETELSIEMNLIWKFVRNKL